ncbi:MAG: hypothetical protein ACREYC_22310, partial [Gammaproteobacteria bacterium]
MSTEGSDIQRGSAVRPGGDGATAAGTGRGRLGSPWPVSGWFCGDAGCNAGWMHDDKARAEHRAKRVERIST